LGVHVSKNEWLMMTERVVLAERQLLEVHVSRLKWLMGTEVRPGRRTAVGSARE